MGEEAKYPEFEALCQGAVWDLTILGRTPEPGNPDAFVYQAHYADYDTVYLVSERGIRMQSEGCEDDDCPGIKEGMHVLVWAEHPDPHSGLPDKAQYEGIVRRIQRREHKQVAKRGRGRPAAKAAKAKCECLFTVQLYKMRPDDGSDAHDDKEDNVAWTPPPGWKPRLEHVLKQVKGVDQLCFVMAPLAPIGETLNAVSILDDEEREGALQRIREQWALPESGAWARRLTEEDRPSDPFCWSKENLLPKPSVLDAEADSGAPGPGEAPLKDSRFRDARDAGQRHQDGQQAQPAAAGRATGGASHEPGVPVEDLEGMEVVQERDDSEAEEEAGEGEEEEEWELEPALEQALLEARLLASTLGLVTFHHWTDTSNKILDLSREFCLKFMPAQQALLPVQGSTEEAFDVQFCPLRAQLRGDWRAIAAPTELSPGDVVSIEYQQKEGRASMLKLHVAKAPLPALVPATALDATADAAGDGAAPQVVASKRKKVLVDEDDVIDGHVDRWSAFQPSASHGVAPPDRQFLDGAGAGPGAGAASRQAGAEVSGVEASAQSHGVGGDAALKPESRVNCS